MSERPERGEELELTVDSLAFGGEGVARLGEHGYVVFVAGAVPGDRVRAVVHKRKRNYAHARTLEVLEPGPDRIPPRAAHPGAPWQVLRYERQLRGQAGPGPGRAAPDGGLRRLRAASRSCPRSNCGATATSSSTPSATASE